MTDPTHPTEPTLSAHSDGTREWRLNGRWHRTGGPAVEYPNGDREWWVNGVLHRPDGPAIERANGGRRWYVHGDLHRTDGPAVEDNDGRRMWFVNGRDISHYVLLYIRQGMTDADAITAVLIDLERENAP